MNYFRGLGTKHILSVSEGGVPVGVAQQRPSGSVLQTPVGRFVSATSETSKDETQDSAPTSESSDTTTDAPHRRTIKETLRTRRAHAQRAQDILEGHL
jgi:hypothetical protein